MKYLILGASGMAGHLISIFLMEHGHEVTGFSIRPIEYVNCIVGDAKDFNLLKQIIYEGNYDIVVNCIGILNSNADQYKTDAILLNSYLPHYIAELIQGSKTKFIHMSTDCVFSGKKGSYTEYDIADGETFYDKSKALGEINTLQALTFRNSIIGPDIKETGIGLFNWFMKQSVQVNGYKKSIWTGVTTLTLAKAIEKASRENLTGIYHLVNNQTINKFELILLFNKYLRKNELNIIPVEGVDANKSLVNTRKDFDFTVPSYEDMIMEMTEWINSHRNLYPYYFN